MLTRVAACFPEQKLGRYAYPAAFWEEWIGERIRAGKVAKEDRMPVRVALEIRGLLASAAIGAGICPYPSLSDLETYALVVKASSWSYDEKRRNRRILRRMLGTASNIERPRFVKPGERRALVRLQDFFRRLKVAEGG